MSDSKSELVAAKRDRDAAKTIMQQKRGEAMEAKREWLDLCKHVEEVLEELCGERPLLAAIAAKSSPNGPAAPEPAAKKTRKRERPDAKLAGLEMPTFKETLDSLTDRRIAESASEPPAAPDVESPVPTPRNAPDATPGPAKTKLPAESKDHAVVTEDDVNAELIHAITHNHRTLGPLNWTAEIVHGATNDQIRQRIMSAWTTSPMFTDRKRSGTREGYTTACAGGDPTFWVGARKSTMQPPDLRGAALIGQVRKLLEIPTPHQVSQRANGTAREPVIGSEGTGLSAPRKVSWVARPSEGWDSASIAIAARDLGAESAERLAICVKCGAARAAGLKCHCGFDGWQMGIEFLDENRKFSQPRKAASRASKRA
jgi:hypothetical protein